MGHQRPSVDICNIVLPTLDRIIHAIYNICMSCATSTQDVLGKSPVKKQSILYSKVHWLHTNAGVEWQRSKQKMWHSGDRWIYVEPVIIFKYFWWLSPRYFSFQFSLLVKYFLKHFKKFFTIYIRLRLFFWSQDCGVWMNRGPHQCFPS